MFGCRGYTNVTFAIPLFALEPFFESIDIQHSDMGLAIIDTGHLIQFGSQQAYRAGPDVPAVRQRQRTRQSRDRAFLLCQVFACFVH